MGLLSALGRGAGRMGRRLSGMMTESKLNQIEDLILRLPPHEQPVADMVLREQGAEAAERWIRSQVLRPRRLFSEIDPRDYDSAGPML